jgi:Ca2+-binding RTX toxin-like protein
MLPAWLRQFARRLAPQSPPTYRKPRPNPRSRLHLEQFEDRVVPATITWINAAGGDWQQPANWDLNRAPNTGDDVVIPDLGTAGPSITIFGVPAPSAGPINSLTTYENVRVGNTAVSSDFVVTGNIAINDNATVTLVNNTTAVTTQLSLQASSASVDQQITTTGGGRLVVEGLGGPIRQTGVGHTVTFGPGLTVTGDAPFGAPRISGVGANTVPGSWVNQGTITAATGDQISFATANTVTNDPGGVWQATGGTFTLNGTWSNLGTISISGGTFNLGGSFTGPGLGTVVATGGSVNLTGTITNTGQTLTLDGPFTYNLTGTINGGTVATTNGAILQVGTTGHLNGVTIEGAVNVPGATSGSAGTLTNVTVSSGSVVNIGNRVGLNGVTVAGTMNIATTGTGIPALERAVQVSNGLTLDGGTINLTTARVSFGSTQTIGGTGTVTYSGPNCALIMSKGATFGTTYTPGGTLTIDAGVTIQAAANNSALSIGGWNADGFADLMPFDTFVNNFGTIRADRLGSVVAIRSRGYNPGHPGGPDGGSVFINTGLLEATGGGTIDVDYTHWHNPAPGQIVMNNSTLNLRGNVPTASLGSITRTGGTVNLFSRIINTGTTFTLDDNRGTWNFAGGTIDGGTFVTTGSGQLLVTASSTLSGGVTLDSPINFSSGGLTINGGLTLNNVTLNLPVSSNNLSFNGTSLLGGTGTILFTGGTISAAGSSSILTVGQNITIRGRGTVGSSNSRLVNQGTIEANISGQTLNVLLGLNNGVGGNSGTLRALTGTTLGVFGGSTWTNSGTISVDGGTLNLNTFLNIGLGTDYRPFAWANTGTVTVTNSTVNLGGVFTQAGLGNFSRAGGTVNLLGTVVGGLTLDDTLGTWRFAGGILDGGTFDVAAGSTARLQVVSLSGTPPISVLRNGVTLNTPLDFAVVNNAKVIVLGGLTLNGITQPIGNTTGIGGTLSFADNGTLGGTGTVLLNFGNLVSEVSGLSLTIGPNIVVEVRAGTVGFEQARLFNQGTIRSVSAATGVFVNLGSINSGGASTGAGGNSGRIEALNGSSLGITGGNGWTNSGTIAATGSTLFINAGSTYLPFSWSSTGTIQATNSTVHLGGVFTQASLNTFTRTGGTVNLTGTITGGLTLTDAIGDVRFNGGTLNGGTFSVAAGSTARLIATTGRGTLHAVTLASPIDIVSVNSAIIDVTGGLTVNTILPLGGQSGSGANAGTLLFNGSQTLRTDGGGEIVLGTSASGNAINQQSTTHVLTIAPGMTICGTAGNVGGTGVLINQGTIRRDAGAGQITIALGNGGRNEGLIDTTVTSTVLGSRTIITANSFGSWTNLGTISSAGGLSVGLQTSETWTNLGTIATTGGLVEFFGQFTQAKIGHFTRTGAGRVIIGAAATLTGDLTLDDSTGSWQLGGAEWRFGTLRTSGSAKLTASDSTSNILRRVILDGELDLYSAQSTVLVEEGLTLNTTLRIGDPAGAFRSILSFRTGTQTLGGTGTIVFGSHTSNQISGVSSAVPTLTIGPGITIRGNQGTLTTFTGILVNQGTLIAEGAGGRIAISNAALIQNQGTVRATGGAEFVFQVGNFSQLMNLRNLAPSGTGSTGTLTGGRWEIGAGSALRIHRGTAGFNSGIQITRLNADLILDGPGSNIYSGNFSTTQHPGDALRSLAAVDASGSLTVTGGRHLIVRGPLTNSGNVTVGPGSEIELSDGLAGRWDADGNADDFTGRSPGTASPDLTYVPGVNGQAFFFEGALSGDVVDIPETVYTRPPNITVSLWLQPTAAVPAGGVSLFADVTLSGATRAWSLSFDGSGRLQFSAGGVLPKTNPIPVGVWTHVVASYDGDTARIYQDGLLVGSFGGQRPLTYDPAGGLLRLGGSFFKGYVDEVMLFDRALTPAEVAALANGGGVTYTQAGGTTTIEGGGTILSPGDTFNLQGGTLTGSGTIDANLVNAARVAPGRSPGFIDITGDYTQTAAGVLSVEIAGRDPNVPQYDRLRVTGTATLDGTLHVDLLDGFQPTPGDEFVFVTSAGRTGQFAVHELPAPGGPQRRLTPIYDPLGLTVQAQQLPPVEFVAATTADDLITMRDVALDAAGNAYVTGFFSGAVDFDREHTHADDRDLLDSGTATHAFLARYLADGSLDWAKSFSTPALAAGTSVAVDGRGDADTSNDLVYAVGYFEGNLTVAGQTLTVTGAADAYVLKTDATGAVVASAQIDSGAAGGVTPEALDLSPDGTGVFVAGQFTQTADFDPGAGTANLSAAGMTDTFVLQLSNSLAFQRAGRIGGLQPDVAHGVAADASGSVWIGGSYQGTTTGLAALTSAGAEDAFLLKLTPNGTGFTTAVADRYGGGGPDLVFDLGVGSDGSVVAAGQFSFSVDFDTTPLGNFTLHSAGDGDSFALKRASDGSFVWARQWGGYRNDQARGVSVDGLGNAYFTGLFQDVVDFDPLDGSFLLQSQGTTTIHAPVDGYVLKLDSAGRFQWVSQFGATDQTTAFGIAVDANDAGAVGSVGEFAGTVDLDPTDGVAFRTSTGVGPNPYLSLLEEKAAPQATIRGLSSVVAEGTTLALAASVTDADSGYFTYSWSVSRDGVTRAGGTGSVFAVHLADQGVYTVTLVVTDESGNSDTRVATVRVTNEDPILGGAAFGGPSLFAGSGATTDNIPSAIATGGGNVLLGVANRDAGAVDAGAVDVYTEAGAFVRTLTAPTAVAAARFGSSVAVVGNHAVVGAPGTGSGTVYVFDLTTGALVQTITAPGAAPGDKFGSSVAAVGVFVAVGAPGRTVDAAPGAGAAYLFDPETGALLQTFRNPTPQPNDEFGTALAAVGGNLLVGAPGDDSAGADAGAAYLFDVGQARMLATVTNPNPTFAGSGFGGVLAASGMRAAVGAKFDDSAGLDAGGVYLFDFDLASTTFGVLLHTFRSPNPSPNGSRFGTALAFDRNRLLVGAEADGTTIGNSGSAFLMDADPDSPTFGGNIRTFKKTTPVAADRFGAAVAFLGDGVLVGAPQDDLPVADAGRVYQFNATSFLNVATSPVGENGTVTVSGSFSDRGANDSHTVSIHWRDGSPSTVVRLPAGVNTFSATHQFLDDNPSGTAFDDYVVSVVVTDDTPDLLVPVTGGGNDRVFRYDGATGSFEGVFVTDTFGDDLRDVVAGPDGHLYALSPGSSAIRRYDGATGAFLDTFVASGAAGSDLVFGPDGNLYVSTASKVVRFRGPFGSSPGAALGDFVTSGSGGLSGAGALAFGPDGNLYVLSSLTDSVLRYNGTTGAFIDVFVPPGTGPVQPTDMGFGPDGNLYVVSGNTAGIFRYDGATGAPLGELVPAVGSLVTPEGITFGAGGSAFVVDTGGDQVVRYDLASGEVLGGFAVFFGQPSGRVNVHHPQDRTTQTVRVNNVAPAVVVRAAPNATPGQYTLSVVVTDPGRFDTVTYSWTITGGTPVGPTNGPTFTFTPTGAAVSVVLTVTDDDTGSVTTRTQVVIGTANPDLITVNNGNTIVNGANIVHAVGTNRVIVYGLGGNDNINAGNVNAIPVELVGGFGNDTLVGGSQSDVLVGNNPGDYALADPYTGDTGNDSLVAGAGNDTLDGGLGNDTMAGGTGNDRYLEVPGSADLLTELGGAPTDIDTIDYSLAFAGVRFSLGMFGPQPVQVVGGVTHTVEIQGSFENLFGTAFSDALSGNSLNNAIAGGGGNDAVYGDSRDLHFTPGAVLLDTLAALTGDGNDTLTGGAGTDTVVGGAGHDIIFGGDLLALLPGDVIPPTSPLPDDGQNSLVGGTGNDTVVGASGNDIIFGGDLLTIFPGLPGGIPGLLPAGVLDNDSIVGGAGNDTVIGGTGNDIIFGGDLLAALSDTTRPTLGVPENNTLIGGLGSDTVVGGTGNDIIFGGDLLVNLPGVPQVPPMPDTSPNSLVGGTGNDTVIGGTGNDIIFGGDLLGALTDTTSPTLNSPDSDTLVGGLGSDTVIGGTGNDIIFGGDLLAALPDFTPPPVPLIPDTSPNSLVGGTGNDTVVGGSGNDIIFGGDLLAALSDTTSPTLTVPENNTLIGGLGSDTVVGGTGNDIIFGGDLLAALPDFTPPPVPPQPDTSPNSLVGGTGNDTIIGGSGNDVIFGGDLIAAVPDTTSLTTTTRVGGGADDDSLAGGLGSDTVVGGSGNDIIFGGDLLAALTDFTHPTLPAGDDTSPNSLVGGTGNDTIIGGSGNDIIFGSAGDDALTGDGGNDQFEGGTGIDTLVETADADFTLTPTQVFVAGVGERFYDIERAVLSGGDGNNRLDASAFTGPVILVGGDGHDTLVGGPGSDQLSGGAGNDSLVGGLGADVLDTGSGADFADGGEGNDTYLLQLGGLQTLLDESGIDSIDLSGSAFGVNADLVGGTIKFNGLTAAIATLGGSFENLRGTSFDDVIVGNVDRNILEGGGGVDDIDGGDAADILQGSFPQVIYLDFDSETGKGEHVYTVEERNQIQDRLEQVFGAPLSVSFSQTAPSVGRFTTMVFNSGEAEALIAGLAEELDWRNVNAASRAEVNVNGFLGRPGQPAATSANYVALTFTVTAHELGHLFGLRHTDSFGPIGSGIYAGLVARVTSEVVTPTLSAPPGTVGGIGVYVLRHSPVLLAPTTQYGNTQQNAFTPPQGTVLADGVPVATFIVNSTGAVEVTPIGNPAHAVLGGFLDPNTGGIVLEWSAMPAVSSVRATYQFDPFRPGYRGPDDAVETPLHIMASPSSVGTTVAHALGNTHFGERELIKLAFNDASRTVAETALPVIAAPAATGATTARDLGTLPGLALPTVAPPVNGYAQVHATNVVGAINLAGPASENDVYAFLGRAGDYLTAEVLSDTLRQRFANTIDSILRVYGPGGQLLTYYGQPAVNDDGIDGRDAILLDVPLPVDGVYYVVVDTFFNQAVPDTDTGGYELFLYTYTPARAGAARLGGEGDELTGGAGPDVLIGSAGDDAFDGDLTEDTFIGFVPELDQVGPKNTAPTVNTEQSHVVAEDGSVTFAAGTDADGDSFTAGITQQPAHGVVTFDAQTGELTYTPHANFHGTDVFRYTLDDGLATSPEAVVSITVTPVNDAPAAGAQSLTTAEDTAVGGTLAGSDVDGDTLTFALMGTAVGGSVTAFDANTGAFTFTPAANFHGSASFTFTVSDGVATSNPATVTITVTAVNDAPTALADSATAVEDGGSVAVDVLANDTAAPDAGETLAVTAVTQGANGAVAFTPAGVTYTPNPNFHGTDSFSYTVSDGNGGTATATVTVTVTPVNDTPTAGAQPLTTAEDAPVTGVLTGSDVDGDALTFALAGAAIGGTVTAFDATTGAFTFTPSANFSGTASFTFTVSDGLATSAPAAVTVAVTPVNDAPTATVVLNTTQPQTNDVLAATATAADVEGDAVSLTYEWRVNGVVRRTVTTTSLSDTFDLALPGNGSRGDAVSVTVTPNDGTEDGASALAWATVANSAPVAIAQAYQTAEDGTLTVPAPGLLAGAADPDDDALAVVAYTQPADGTVSVAPDGSFTYAPTGAFTGTLTFTYTVGDGELTATATATITVRLVGVFPSGGNLFVYGTAGADAILVAQSESGVSVTMNGIAFGPFTVTGVIRVFGREGNDSLTVESGVAPAAELHGEGGNDSLRGGNGNDLLYGGEGDDFLVAVSGHDSLYGGTGNDLLHSGSGNDILHGEAGNDVLLATSGHDTLQGGSGNDIITGGSGNDVLYGGEGDDALAGGSGNDAVYAGVGNDSLAGGAGDDFLEAGAGNDWAHGGSGADILVGGAGDDVLIGGSGNDFIIGGFGCDSLIGESADDILIGGYTVYDQNEAALRAILALWNATSGYQARIAALQSPAFAHRLVANQTVLDDGAADSLTGSSGADWFFANVDGEGARDVITDLGGQEVTTDPDE